MQMDIKEPVRVLQIFNSLNKGGAESRTLDVYRQLDRKKVQFDFVVLSPNANGAKSVEDQYYYQEIVRLGGKVFPIASLHLIGVKAYFSQWQRIVNSGHYKVAHAHTGWAAGIPLFFLWWYKVPKRIAHARDSGVELHSSFKQKLFFHFVRMCTNLLSTDKIYCSREASDFAFGKKKTEKKRFYFLPNAINLSQYKSTLGEEERKALRAELGIDKEDIVIGTVGNARPVKNHIFLVKAFHEFLSLVPKAKLLIVGKDDQDEEAKQYASANELQNAVLFVGQRNDIPQLLQLMDVFLLPSFKEGAPGVVIEAQAANVPCILSDSITRDVDVGTGLLKYISLDASFDIWTQEMLDSCKSTRPLKEQTLEKLKSAGYDVVSSLEKLLSIYEIS